MITEFSISHSIAVSKFLLEIIFTFETIFAKDLLKVSDCHDHQE